MFCKNINFLLRKYQTPSTTTTTTAIETSKSVTRRATSTSAAIRAAGAVRVGELRATKPTNLIKYRLHSSQSHRPKSIETSTKKPNLFKLIMEKLKNLKNSIRSPSTENDSPLIGGEPSSTNNNKNKSDDLKTRRQNESTDKSLVDNEKQKFFSNSKIFSQIDFESITNILPFRSPSDTNNTNNTSNGSGSKQEKQTSKVFLRSKSQTTDNVRMKNKVNVSASTESTHKNGQSIGQQQFNHNQDQQHQQQQLNKQTNKQTLANDSGQPLFDRLGKHLDELIQNFRPDATKEIQNLSFESPLNKYDRSTTETNEHHTQTPTPTPTSTSTVTSHEKAANLFEASTTLLETSDASANTYFRLAVYAQQILTRTTESYTRLEANCHLYDFESTPTTAMAVVGSRVKSNGYRSLLKIFDDCCKRLLIIVVDLNEKKTSFLSNIKLNATLPGGINSNFKEFQTWVKLIEKIEIILRMALEMQNISLRNFRSKSPIMNAVDHSADSAGSVTETSKSDLESFQFHDNSPSLFLSSKDFSDTFIETDLFYLGSIYQDSFFGSTCGFQFCESLQKPLTGCAVALASYNDGYEAYSNKENQQVSSTSPPSNIVTSTTTATSTSTSATTPELKISTNSTTFANQGILQAFSNSSSNIFNSPYPGTFFKSIFSGTKYLLDPDLRAKKISKIMRNADVEFCKAFWQLTEKPIVQIGSDLATMNCNVKINELLRISTSIPIRLPRVKHSKSSETSNNNDATATNTTNSSISSSVSISNDHDDDFVLINPPQGSKPDDSIRIRLLSMELLNGMQNIENFKTNDLTPKPPSRHLILHAHGGGFIAHSSKSHEIYLKPWCKELQAPIVSIDYSLAPEYPFPRASEECFYVYAWCLSNKDYLGWTGEKIVCVGDSAGGVLVTNIVQRAIVNEIRIPDALIPIYTPFLLNYSLSPSRLMSVMDPLLNLGVLWRCLAAYCGIDFKLEAEKLKNSLKLNNNQTKQQMSVDKSPLAQMSPTATSPVTTKSSQTKRISSFLLRTNSINLTTTTPAPTTAQQSSPAPTILNRIGHASIKFKKSFDSVELNPKENPKISNDECLINFEPIKENESPIKPSESDKPNKIDEPRKLSLSKQIDQDQPTETTTTNEKNQSICDSIDKKRIEKLIELYNVLGDSIFLIEKLRDHPLTVNHYMSPLLTDDSILSKFPPTCLITSSQDPLLDDNIEFQKKLLSLNVTCKLDVFQGLHHGFLNFVNCVKANKDCRRASKHITKLIKLAINSDSLPPPPPSSSSTTS